MGRYTTVQAYADNNPNMRAVDYHQATGTAAAASTGSGSAAAAPPADRGHVVAEKVDNPYGSTAGAGSGEFHVYRHARAREMARWKKINEDEAESNAENVFQQQLAHDTNSEEAKTEKKRRKRERAKEAKRRKKNMKLGGVGGFANEEEGGDGEEEFEYTPAAASEIPEGALKSDNGSSEKAEDSPANEDEESSNNAKPAPEEEDGKVPFANDGSFLERMKKELANTE
eukprot:CAMPEP_0201870352 /NCGR_PEP_ID=MMETSP0902-20130614/3477_1 /ASSEMBLY_ACC=CAM_ASM_000551 /TAXON_ID=420261 /ORGANISM="Thalassiosira antarctica, Strain CCMP982" /LENGTH=227 /DNA_ID=CAMNT_0048395943 /DNA_START=94 /DNA_END=777 /DNA_ORIENTATION=+